jgi:hypothetical protein
LNDLLPLPYDEETLALIVRHVDEVQEGLGRPYLVENPSSYIGFRGSTMSEAQFLRELVRRSGCRLVLKDRLLAIRRLAAPRTFGQRRLDCWRPAAESNAGFSGDLTARHFGWQIPCGCALSRCR